MDNKKYTFEQLLEIVDKLRDDKDGCPWDKAQTHESIRQNFIEEAYEAVDAINKNDTQLLKEELGDVLLQVLLHAQFEKEKGNFDFNDVSNMLAEKLVTRHPHIFKDLKADNKEQALENWEEIKNKTNGYNNVSQRLFAVPKNFPSLMYAQKVQKRIQASKLPLDNVEKVSENIHDLVECIVTNESDNEKEKLSELIFQTVNLTRLKGYDAEELLKDYSIKTVDLFYEFEQLLLQKGTKFDTIGETDFLELWNKAEDAFNK